MDIVRAYEKLKMNKVNIKENDELLNMLINRFQKGISDKIVAHSKDDFDYHVTKLMERGFTDVLIEETEDAYALYREKISDELKIEGTYIIS